MYKGVHVKQSRFLVPAGGLNSSNIHEHVEARLFLPWADSPAVVDAYYECLVVDMLVDQADCESIERNVVRRMLWSFDDPPEPDENESCLSRIETQSRQA